MLVPPDATELDKVNMRRAYGLDRPVLYQFGAFAWRAVQGDFGRSFFSDRPALSLVFERLPASVELAVASTLIAIMLILWFGVMLQWLPVSGRFGWTSVVLPSVALSVWLLALLARLTRSEMLEVLGQDFIRTARAK